MFVSRVGRGCEGARATCSVGSVRWITAQLSRRKHSKFPLDYSECGRMTAVHLCSDKEARANDHQVKFPRLSMTTKGRPQHITVAITCSQIPTKFTRVIKYLGPAKLRHAVIDITRRDWRPCLCTSTSR